MMSDLTDLRGTALPQIPLYIRGLALVLPEGLGFPCIHEWVVWLYAFKDPRDTVEYLYIMYLRASLRPKMGRIPHTLALLIHKQRTAMLAAGTHAEHHFRPGVEKALAGEFARHGVRFRTIQNVQE